MKAQFDFRMFVFCCGLSLNLCSACVLFFPMLTWSLIIEAKPLHNARTNGGILHLVPTVPKNKERNVQFYFFFLSRYCLKIVTYWYVKDREKLLFKVEKLVCFIVKNFRVKFHTICITQESIKIIKTFPYYNSKNGPNKSYFPFVLFCRCQLIHNNKIAWFFSLQNTF